jgi:hypothetical protein
MLERGLELVNSHIKPLNTFFKFGIAIEVHISLIHWAKLIYLRFLKPQITITEITVIVSDY